MAYLAKNITLPRELIKKMDGLVILSLEEYEQMKEDLEMARSKKLTREIEKSRKEARKNELIGIEELERKLNL